MKTDKDILDQPTTYSGTTSSRSITKGEEMTNNKIKKAISELTNNDQSQLFDIAYAVNLILTNEELTKALKENPVAVCRIAYELSAEQS